MVANAEMKRLRQALEQKLKKKDRVIQKGQAERERLRQTLEEKEEAISNGLEKIEGLKQELKAMRQALKEFIEEGRLEMQRSEQTFQTENSRLQQELARKEDILKAKCHALMEEMKATSDCSIQKHKIYGTLQQCFDKGER